MNDSKFDKGKSTPAPPVKTKELVEPDEDESKLGCCTRMNPFVLNHEYLDLQAHDKGSGNIKCMSCCQLGFKIFYYIFLIMVIVYSFVYPILQNTGSGDVKKIRTFESQNQFKQKTLTFEEFGIQYFAVLEDKKDVVKKLYEENWYWDAFLALNPTYYCDQINDGILIPVPGKTVDCSNSRRRLQPAFLGSVDDIQDNAAVNDEKTSDAAKDMA